MPSHAAAAGAVTSYVVTRGSIPLLWTQLPNIKYKPTTVIGPADVSGPVRVLAATALTPGLPYLACMIYALHVRMAHLTPPFWRPPGCVHTARLDVPYMARE